MFAFEEFGFSPKVVMNFMRSQMKFEALTNDDAIGVHVNIFSIYFCCIPTSQLFYGTEAAIIFGFSYSIRCDVNE